MSTRELDKKVALAMGWEPPSKRGRCDVCGWHLVKAPVIFTPGCVPDNCSMRPRPEPRADRIAAYSTDHAALPEMLAWLDKLGSWKVLRYTGASARYEAFGQGVSFVQGATLPEAVANLVVALHERRDK
jgi:hypothetical protein